MSDPHTSAAIGIGLKSGALAGLIAGAVSVLAIVVGFTVVPLAPGRELQDAARRLAAGLLCSFTLGPIVAVKAFEWWPGLMTPWAAILEGQHVLWQYLAAATPFIAGTGVLGFWLVAGVMRYFERRQHLDAKQMLDEIRGGGQ